MMAVHDVYLPLRLPVLRSVVASLLLLMCGAFDVHVSLQGSDITGNGSAARPYVGVSRRRATNTPTPCD